MTTQDDPEDAFEANRSRLWGLAYRMLSSTADADDVVQDAWIRWNAATDIDVPAAWLTTVTTRLAIDRLRSARHRRETYVGPWLPEPILTTAPTDDPAHIVEVSESLTLGFLTVLDRLEPVDRAVFLLREVFALPYAEVAAVVERSEENVRQINSRARQRVQRDRPAVDLAPDRREELLDAFLEAVLSGDPRRLEPLLHDDVVQLSDGGASTRAARRPVVGPHRVSILMVNLAKRITALDWGLERVVANGQPAMLVTVDSAPQLLQEIEFAPDGRIIRLHHLLNPDKLALATRDLDTT